MGTIPDMISVLKSESAAETVVVPGGLSIAYLEDGEWKVKDVLMHDGSKLSQVIIIVIYYFVIPSMAKVVTFVS